MYIYTYIYTYIIYLHIYIHLYIYIYIQVLVSGDLRLYLLVVLADFLVCCASSVNLLFLESAAGAVSTAQGPGTNIQFDEQHFAYGWLNL